MIKKNLYMKLYYFPALLYTASLFFIPFLN